MAVYDDEEQKLGTDSPADEELRKLTGIGKDEESTMDREAHTGAAADIAEREGLSRKSDDDAYGPSAADRMSDRLGRGYTDDGKKSGISRALNSKSKLKKRLAIAAAVAGGGIIASAILFFALLPLKIENIVTNLEKRYGAASSQALGKETSHLLRGYLTKYLIPALGTKRCKTTVDPSCVVTVAGDGPVKQMYKAWKNERFEQKLADYGLVFGRSGNTYYINIDGKRSESGSRQKLLDFINDPDTTRGTKADIEHRLSQFLKEKTFWERVYYRFRLAPFVNKKVGTRHCINACKKINEFKDNLSTKKRAAKAYTLDRVLTPLSENYSFILQCILVGKGECNVSSLQNAEEGDTTLETDADRGMRDRLRARAATYGDKKLADLVKAAEDLEKDGFSKYFVRKMTEKLVEASGRNGAAAGATAAKAVDPITWVLIAAQLSDSAQKIGPILKYMSYAANTAAAAQLFTAYQTVASETKSGQIDAAQLGSFANALDSSLDTSNLDSMDAAAQKLKEIDSDVTPSSATQTPYYQAIMGTGKTGTNTASVFSSFVSGSASAASTSSDSGYTCDNNKPVKSGDLVCEEEHLDRGTTGLGSFIATMSGWYSAYINAVPGLSDMLGIINKLNGAISWTIDKLIEWVASPAAKAGCKAIAIASPGDPCKATMNKISDASEIALKFVTDQLLQNPFAKLSGGRLFDMLGAGASYTFNQSAQENLGAGYVSDATSAKIQTAYLNEQQQQFEERPLFARMFSTDTPYSLVSKVASDMPGSLSIAGNSLVASIQQSPLNVISAMFGSIFTLNHASAATTSMVANPFGVPQSAYTNGEIPNDPEKFWDKNCVNGPLGVWHADAPVGQQLDISEWLNKNQSDQRNEQLKQIALISSREKVIATARAWGMNVVQDPSTGQAIYLRPNQCSLILSSVQAAGGFADPTLLPADSLTSDSTGSGGASFRIATFNVLGASHPSPLSYTERADRAINTITSKSLDIVGLQEFQVKQRSYIYPRIKDTYDIFPDASSKNNDHNVENSIIWNRNKFDFVRGDYQPNLRYFCGSHLNAPYVKLRAKNTGQEFYVLNTHDPANADHCPSESPKLRYENALEHDKFMKQLESEGLPLLYTGDFNSKYALVKSGNGSPYQGKASNLTYCILAVNASYNDAFDAYKKRPVTCPNKTPPGAAGGIDHVYLSKSIQVTNYLYVEGGRQGNGPNGADHPTIIFDVTIPAAGGTSKSYKNSVYDGSAPDPGVIRGSDGVYHVYTTGGDQLYSTDMVTWKRVSAGWNLKGAPRADCNWAPDVAKVRSYYVLTYARIPSCSSVGGVSSSSTISYAVGTSAGGPFQYQGSITDMGYAIDPHIFVDSNGKIWLNFGGGVIYLVQLNMSGKTLKMVGAPKPIFSKTSSPTIENGWIEKKGTWYYLYYSQGHWNIGDGAPEYSTRIARSKTVTGPYQPTAYKTILSGNDQFWGPGGGSITTDDANTDWFVYHAWNKGKRVLLIDRITYQNGWPIISNGKPSTTTQNGPVIGGGGG